MTQAAFPLTFDASGHTAQTTGNDHITDLIEQVLFTSPGERVNRPTFGSGLLQTVFAPAGDAMSATLNVVVQSALQQWLGSLISVGQVTVASQKGSRIHYSNSILGRRVRGSRNYVHPRIRILMELTPVFSGIQYPYR